MAKVDLNFIAGQVVRLISDLDDLKDHMAAVVARVERLEAAVVARVEPYETTSETLLSEVRAMRGRPERLARRADHLVDREHDDPSQYVFVMLTFAGYANPLGAIAADLGVLV